MCAFWGGQDPNVAPFSVAHEARGCKKGAEIWPPSYEVASVATSLTLLSSEETRQVCLRLTER